MKEVIPINENPKPLKYMKIFKSHPYHSFYNLVFCITYIDSQLLKENLIQVYKILENL